MYVEYLIPLWMLPDESTQNPHLGTYPVCSASSRNTGSELLLPGEATSRAVSIPVSCDWFRPTAGDTQRKWMSRKSIAASWLIPIWANPLAQPQELVQARQISVDAACCLLESFLPEILGTQPFHCLAL